MDKNHTSVIRNPQFVVASLLLSMATAGLAIAQNPWPVVYQPLMPDTKIPGAAGFTLTVHGTGFAILWWGILTATASWTWGW